MRKWNRTGEVQVEATVPVEGSGCEVPDPSGQGQCISESADGQIREALPVPGVHVILGNILAGARVWPSGPAPPVRSIEPIEANKQGDWVTEVPKDCTAGVTGAKSRAQSGRGSNRISGLKCEKKSGLIGWCVFCHFFGIFLSGDKVFRAIGNVLFTTQLSLVIVVKCTFRFFFQEHTGRTTSFFLGAVFGVVIGWPIVGVDFKIFGFMLLYSGFTPHVKGRSIVHGLMRGRTLGMGCAGMGLAC
ncbi:uncharacterized protein LOC122133810 [Clupea harengus]|uniref:Uncharacterized protein LOC122133810 n=1 Tax=Clupea harengus TaxID=7950 RepID=A0A8M1KRD1_CLUHA|nr:uncharacterized protein LOC122133810 [Clupea harengus]